MTYNVSSSPHIRHPLSTGRAMYDVIIALTPATLFGIWHFGLHALLVALMSIVSALTTEYVFDYITGRENTLYDGSAVVTGLLLALCIPASVPLYVPYIGAVFAILIVKCLFGGLGKNFMNPALGGRVFLLLSFGGAMTRYTVDGVTSATPLAQLDAGTAVNVVRMFTGHAGGVLGCSTFALLMGGLYLWVVDAIPWRIPASVLVSFCAFMALFGGDGFDLYHLCAHLTGGGIVMAAFFMATDPVTSPVTAPGQLLYGCLVGFFSAAFRVYGSSADSVSYAVILSNLAVPLMDELIIPKPFAYRKNAAETPPQFVWKTPSPSTCAMACVLGVSIALLCGVSGITAGVVERRQLAEHLSAYRTLLPNAVDFWLPRETNQAISDMDGLWNPAYGNSLIQEAATGTDAVGAAAGHVVTVRSLDGRDAPITLSVGFLPDGTVSGILYSELNETPGIGMKVGDDAFAGQFKGIPARALTLGADIDAVSGATVSSRAVLNAVNAAIDFHAAYGATMN
ncbi:MAG: RnfABCDGE type electron transport complex subunit D [Oscillibacter sp.]|nr:RnfABCDGE type electron transport complex subunit D [Oscillibacter sp.]